MFNYLNLVRPWKTGPARELLKTRVFSVHARESVSAEDPKKAGEDVHLRRPDWVNVIALTPDRRVVMIEQYRHGVDAVTLEVPGGIAEPGERPEDTCARELAEETGYGGRSCAIIGRVSANPAIQNNWVHTGFIRDAVPREDVNPDEHEEIGLRLVSLDEVPELIRQGVIHHAFVVAAFQHFALAGLS